jgi:hypothetical protein
MADGLSNEEMPTVPRVVSLLTSPFHKQEHVDLWECINARPVVIHDSLQIANFVRSDSEVTWQRELAGRLACTTEVTGNAQHNPIRRFVEPGVGRSCVATEMSFDAETVVTPNLYNDFLLTGMGLTPYSKGGFVNVGRKLDGRLSSVRAEYRRRCAEKLTAIGCRAPATAAIFELPDSQIKMPNGTFSCGAIMLRGFRSLFRVKQLDPIACALHSQRHSVEVLNYFLAIVSKGRNAYKEVTSVNVSQLALAFDVYGPGEFDLPFLLNHSPLSASQKEVRDFRLSAIRINASAIIRHVYPNVCQNGAVDCPENYLERYAFWFSAELGAQLGKFKANRFLHDYHFANIKRSGRWVYSLVENNVTLAAEFADLETGVFVDSPVDELSNFLQLSDAEIQYIRNFFLRLHWRDVLAALRIAQTIWQICGITASFNNLNYCTELFFANYHKTAKEARYERI